MNYMRPVLVQIAILLIAVMGLVVTQMKIQMGKIHKWSNFALIYEL